MENVKVKCILTGRSVFITLTNLTWTHLGAIVRRYFSMKTASLAVKVVLPLPGPEPELIPHRHYLYPYPLFGHSRCVVEEWQYWELEAIKKSFWCGFKFYFFFFSLSRYLYLHWQQWIYRFIFRSFHSHTYRYIYHAYSFFYIKKSRNLHFEFLPRGEMRNFNIVVL